MCYSHCAVQLRQGYGEDVLHRYFPGVGYVLTLLLVKTGVAPAELMNLGAMADHTWFELPGFVLPKFDLKAIGMIAPIAIVTCVEHVGDVYANGSVVGRDFTKKSGLHRTMLGDGLATMAAGLIGVRPIPPIPKIRRCWRQPVTITRHLCGLAALIAIVVSFFRQGHRRDRNRAQCGIGRRVHRAVWDDFLRGPADAGGKQGGFYPEPQSFHRGGDAGAVHWGAVIGGTLFSISGIGLGIIAGILLNLILPEKKEKEAGLVAHGVDEKDVREGRLDNPDEERLAREKEENN